MFHTVSPSHLRGAVGHRQYDGGQRRLGALCGRGELHSDGQCGAEETGLLAACPHQRAGKQPTHHPEE